ncbi:MAG: diaminopimelate decarboxylase [Gammaproteobacteria bacterium]
MDFFNYRNEQLFAEDVSVAEIAKRWGTPCYIYSRATLERHWHVFDHALSSQLHQICYAVKANSNLAVLQIIARLGSGFDVVSAGELARVLKAGGVAERVVFSGVGKTTAEMQYALTENIGCFNVESIGELERLNQIAGELRKRARIALRVNPDIDARTHRYIATGLKENKFGIPIDEALMIYDLAGRLPNIQVIGVACHIGSQLTELAPFIDAAQRLMTLVKTLRQRGFNIQHLSVGGGLGVRYHQEQPPTPAEYARALLPHVADATLTIIIEPGRAIAANAGILVTKVEYLKAAAEKNFAVVDAGMNDLIRPALYEAWHTIIPVSTVQNAVQQHYDVVGPVCETSDFFGKDRALAISSGDLLAIRTAGAYGFSMSSNYNSRPRAAEILVDGEKAYLVRARETIEDLLVNEKLI